jgi:hypothetical protein
MCLFIQEYNISMKNITEGTDVENIKKCLYFFSYFGVVIPPPPKGGGAWGQSKD